MITGLAVNVDGSIEVWSRLWGCWSFRSKVLSVQSVGLRVTFQKLTS